MWLSADKRGVYTVEHSCINIPMYALSHLGVVFN